MLVLVSIGSGIDGDFVPHIGVTVTLALMVADLGVLIYFIHHTAISIQLPQVIAGIAADLAEAIKEQGSGNSKPQHISGPTAIELLSRARPAGACCSRRRAGTCSSSSTENWSGWRRKPTR